MHRKAAGEVIVQPSGGDEEGGGITLSSRGVGKPGLRLYTLGPSLQMEMGNNIWGMMVCCGADYLAIGVMTPSEKALVQTQAKPP